MVLKTFEHAGSQQDHCAHYPRSQSTRADRVVHIRDGRLLTVEQEREYVLQHRWCAEMAGGASLSFATSS